MFSFLQKIINLKKIGKKIFFYFWRLKVSAHKRLVHKRLVHKRPRLKVVDRTHAVSSARARVACAILAHAASRETFVLWLFQVYLYRTIQYKVFQKLGIHLPVDSCL